MLNLNRYGNGLPILCLHGWGFDHSIWRCLESVWPNSWQMITVDLPGHGQTKPMSMDSFTAQLLQQLPPFFVVIGWSLGGLYAFHLANKAGVRVKHMFSVATSPCFIKQKDWPGIEPVVLTRFYRRFIREPIRTVQDFIALQFLNQDHKPTIDYSPALPSDAELGLILLKACDHRYQIETSPKIMSFLLGQQDAIVPASVANVLQTRLAIEDVCVIQHCGHMPFFTHRDLFIRYLGARL